MTRVLVVDDDPCIVRMMSLMLTTSGFDVCTATDGRQALALVDREQPDAVILDLDAPMAGEAFIETMRARGIATPVIVTNGAMRRDLRTLGVAAVVPKPFRADAVVSIIERVVRGPQPFSTELERGRSR